MKKIAILSLKVLAAIAVITTILCVATQSDMIGAIGIILALIAILPALWVGALITITESINFVKGGIKK